MTERARKPATAPSRPLEPHPEGESMDWDAVVDRLQKMLDDMEDE
jgi:hypothetical protein